MTTVRTRMAPSPTGEYHIGHIRTVLYNYAFSHKHGGKFIIRIEDTDQTRFVEGAQERILAVIKDYNLSWDEGPEVGGKYGPYVQSERLAIYKKYALELIQKGSAYYCFCTTERLARLKEEQQKAGKPSTMYDRKCLGLSKPEIDSNLEKDTPYVIRLKMPTNEKIAFDDLVYGHLEFDSSEIDDTVLLKSDGYPTYHLGVVIDDHLMEVTHVMRGNDWLPSTPKHVVLYQAFGWEMPTHIHLPNLKELGENKKLSKRFGAVFAIDFLAEGYLPEAVNNFLMFLGWNPGTEKELYSLTEFIADFSIEKIHKTDLVAFDREKLLWYNGVYIRQMTDDQLFDRLTIWAKKFEVDLHTNSADKKFNIKVIALIKERLKKFSEFVSLTHYFYNAPNLDSVNVFEFTADQKKGSEILHGFYTLYEKTTNWDASILDSLSHAFIQEANYKPKEAFMTLRLALTGEKATPGIFEVLELLGKKEVLKRLSSISSI